MLDSQETFTDPCLRHLPTEHAEHLQQYMGYYANPVPIDVKLVSPDAKMPTKGIVEENDHITYGGIDFIFNVGYDIHVVQDEGWQQGLHTYEDNKRVDYPSEFTLYPHESYLFSTGIKVATPPNWGFLFRDRSGIGMKCILVTAGVIEGTYRNEWKVKLLNMGKVPHTFHVGDRIIQAVLVPIIPSVMRKAEGDLPESTRGEKGWGSSGR